MDQSQQSITKDNKNQPTIDILNNNSQNDPLTQQIFDQSQNEPALKQDQNSQENIEQNEDNPEKNNLQQTKEQIQIQQDLEQNEFERLSELQNEFINESQLVEGSNEDEKKLIPFYFMQSKLSQMTNNKVKEISQQIIDMINGSVLQKIESGQQHIMPIQGNIDEILSLMNLTPLQEFEIQQKKHQLQEAKKNKEQIEQQLKSLEYNIDILSSANIITNKRSSSDEFTRQKQSYERRSQPDNQFMKLMMKEKREREQRLQQKLIEQEKIHRQQLEMEMQQKLIEKEQALIERKEKVQKSIELLKQRQQERYINQKQSEERFKKVLNEVPKYQEINYKYQTEILKELQDKKKKLAEIRDLRRRPLDFDDINNHGKTYEQLKQEKEAERLNQIKSRNTDWIYQKPNYESKAGKLWEQEQLERMNDIEDKYRLPQEVTKRRKQFAEKVKEEFIPKIDHKKELEIKFKIEEQQNKNKLKLQLDEQQKFEMTKQIGKKYLQESKIKRKQKQSSLYLQASSQPSSQQNLAEVQHTTAPTDIRYHLGDQSINNHLKNQLLSNSNDGERSYNNKGAVKKIDRNQYLQELRRKHSDGETISQKLQNKMQNLLQNQTMDIFQKKQLIATEVKKAEEKAERMDVMIRHSNSQMDGCQEVADIYLTSIKAKLSILQSELKK